MEVAQDYISADLISPSFLFFLIVYDRKKGKEETGGTTTAPPECPLKEEMSLSGGAPWWLPLCLPFSLSKKRERRLDGPTDG